MEGIQRRVLLHAGGILPRAGEPHGGDPRRKAPTGGRRIHPLWRTPIDYTPSVVAFTPRYRLTWFRDGVTEVAKQDLYPYASAGPVVYTYPSSRRALVEIFGRFQTPKRLWTGWGRATTFDLLKSLQSDGLPMVAPEVRVPQGAPSQLPAASPDAGLAGGTMASLPQGGSAWIPAPLIPTLLLVLVLALFWVRHRRGETTVMHDVGA